MHLALAPAYQPAPDGPRPARAGLVVSRAVGGSVVRSRTSRRLRHLLRARLDRMPSGARLVVRASPAAGDADSAALGRDLDAALARLGLAQPAPAGPGPGHDGRSDAGAAP